jgi:methionine-rich copper-binding protein CopC
VRRWIGIGAALAVLLTAALLAREPQPAGRLAATAPADGATLATAPTAVDLDFTAPVEEFHVAVRDASGAPVTVGRTGRGGPNGVRQPVSIAAPGAVTVIYHVTFAGGGALTGTVRFGVGVAVTPGADDAFADDAFADDGSHGHGVDPFSAALLVLDGAVAVGAVLLLMLRPRRRAAGSQRPS